MSAREPRPTSDVSVGVGLAGLAGLLLWILVCREWAAVADLLGLPGPRAPLSGPARVIDGDSLTIGSQRVRLFGIDAPELAQTCTEANGKSWLCGRAAKAKLTTLIKGGNVNCESRATDRFGRIVAVCSAAGVPDLGEAMVRDGYAVDLGGAAGNPYREAEAEAQTAKRGIWRGTFERPADWRLANPRTE